MSKIRESISLKQFTITSVINILDTFLFFYTYKYTFSYLSLKYLTNITLYFNAIYLFLAYICDISFFVIKSQKLEGLNYFLRYKFCNVINPISYLVFLFFWIMVATGGILGSFNSPIHGLFSVYAHLLINFFVIIDLYINDHDIHKFSWLTFSFILLYIICYGIILIICDSSDIYTYEFLNNISTFGFIGYGILSIIISFGCYMFHIFLLKLKYKYIIKNKEKQDFNEEVNKIIQMNDMSKTSTDFENE